MSEFQNQGDIGNRALQHCGAEMMDPTLGFAEASKNARQVSFVYGKLRQAELRRNLWRFATRRAALRAIDTNTMLLSPAMWVAGSTYFTGSIVSDASNNLWISRIPNNKGNDPANSTTWEPYFGPLTVMLYDSTLTYLSGELVYTAPGDGTYNVYLSTTNANALDPSIPDEWSVSTTYFKNNVVQVFPTYAGGTTYAAGQTVQYTPAGSTLPNVYASLAAGNVGNQPDISTAKWQLVPTVILPSLPAPAPTPPAPITSSPVVEWAQATTYALGNFVLFNGTEYLSIAAANTGNFPSAAGSIWWVALSLGTSYMSLTDLNIGNNPASGPALWAAGTTYATGNKVGGSDGVIYSSIAGGNVGHDPTTDAGVHWTNTGVLNPWTTVFTEGGGNQQWMQIGGALAPSGVALSELGSTMYWPIGSGPATQATTPNVFRLPSGYLFKATQNPKAGAVSYLGFPGAIAERDWVFEGNYIISREIGPIVFRFVADVTDVTTFDAMFCEGLAAVIAKEVCEPLTQSTAKHEMIDRAYDKAMFQARIRNAIEIDPEDPPLDDYIACRF
jgi:hypothetical protein